MVLALGEITAAIAADSIWKGAAPTSKSAFWKMQSLLRKSINVARRGDAIDYIVGYRIRTPLFLSIAYCVPSLSPARRIVVLHISIAPALRIFR